VAAMSDLGIALVDALDDDALERLARRLGPRLLEIVGADLMRSNDGDRWLTTKDAAAYLGLSVNALHKLTAARQVPFAQDTTGGKCWFLRSELDAWRRGG
jgi:excisionase family DNA binding protein